ncbi:hypothetical protein AYI69_g5236 [Smittium culicis]|uniref:Uncharacterized protein n=1 Tax=Smittium culicis TaxID=133412 RepID=A0A1R1Y7H3_9FUNG|nr:hypothetical protein AYI69_g5236 [Smittium culicis]
MKYSVLLDGKFSSLAGSDPIPQTKSPSPVGKHNTIAANPDLTVDKIDDDVKEIQSFIFKACSRHEKCSATARKHIELPTKSLEYLISALIEEQKIIDAIDLIANISNPGFYPSRYIQNK